MYVSKMAIPFSSNFIELHGHCDTSEEAIHHAFTYLSTIKNNESSNARLLFAKTCVAPLKAASIPQFQSNGALMLVEPSKKIADAWSSYIQSF